ncbi:PUA-like domain-containing protein [Lanmaoa asiatica]|nr:PUA-like domain-containing protein [Lanmaoa asiatica]
MRCGRDLRGTKAAPKNLRTAGQSFDQSFEHKHNKALKRSVETGKPVRVIRGYKLRSKYGPSEGYRYDGLYVVKKFWQEKGLNEGGFLVCKYAFVRLPDQLPVAVKSLDGEEADEAQSTATGESDAEGSVVSDD